MKRKIPSKLLLGARTFRVVVFKVDGRTELGVPRECRLLADTESVELQGGEEFITAYVDEAVLRLGN